MSHRNYSDLIVDTAQTISLDAPSSGRYTYPLGTILPSLFNNSQMHSVAENYYPCDGRSCEGTILASLYGILTTPDLRGQFIRGFEGSGEARLSRTRRPVNPFVFAVNNAGTHTHSGGTDTAGVHNHGIYSIVSVGENSRNTSSAGTHSHTLNINASGAHTHGYDMTYADMTEPYNLSVNFFIRVN
jgi:hypothetical protein